MKRKLALAVLLACSSPLTAWATDLQAVGASCPTNNVTAGPNKSGQTVICTGGAWALVSSDTILLGPTTSATNPQVSGDGTTGLFTPAAGAVAVATGGTERLRINSSGSVGIGTTTPGSLLQVGGSAATATATPTAIELDNSYRNAIGGNMSLKFYLYKNGTETYGMGLNDDAGVEFHAGDPGSGSTHNAYYAFYTDDNEEVRITDNGSVGIGTTNPKATLDVNGPMLNECVTVSTLPSGYSGMRHCVTDAASCAFMTPVSGGGSTVCPVFYNGSAWVGG